MQPAIPESPIPAAFLAFDSTTGLLAAGSWGASLVVSAPDGIFTITPTFGVSAPIAPGDAFAEVFFSTVPGALTSRGVQQTWTGGTLVVTVTDPSGAAATVPANSRVFIRIWRRNASLS